MPLIGKRFQIIREEAGLSQAQMALRLGLARSSISKVERGNLELSYASLRILATDFQISIDWLITGDGEMRRNQNGSRVNTDGKAVLMERLARMEKRLSDMGRISEEVTELRQLLDALMPGG